MTLGRALVLLLAAAAATAASLAGAAGSAGAAVEQVRKIPYGEADGQQLLLDAYLPEGSAGPVPGVILVHGGGWRGQVGGEVRDQRSDVSGARSGCPECGWRRE